MAIFGYFLMMWCGIAIGIAWSYVTRSKPPDLIPTFLAEVNGSPPRWSVDHLASQVAAAIGRVETQQATRVVDVVRATRVRFVPHRFLPNDPETETVHGNLVAVYQPSGRVIVMDGPGWERRLAWGLNQRVRIELHGMPVRAAKEQETPAFAAGDTAAREVANGDIQGHADGAREVGAVVAG